MGIVRSGAGSEELPRNKVLLQGHTMFLITRLNIRAVSMSKAKGGLSELNLKVWEDGCGVPIKVQR
jgi:hypothetical protein